jgi:hypothetical protein
MENSLDATPAQPGVRAGELERRLSPEEAVRWHKTLAAGIKSQQLVPGGIAVGGTAAALYAGHRVSHDVDNLLLGLQDNFDAVLEGLEQSQGWKTARIQKPVLILGKVDEVEIGYRQARRTETIAAIHLPTSAGEIIIPTLAEIIGMKAFLAYARNAVRDYLDFAALSAASNG